MNMGELDQVFDNYSKKNRQYNKEEWIEYKKQEKQGVYALIDTTAEKIVQDEIGRASCRERVYSGV